MIRQRELQSFSKRPAAALIMMVVCIIGLFGLVALAIEIGVVAIARSQAQNAADSGAMTGARSINGNSTNNYNVDIAPTKAVNAVAANSLLGSAIVADSAGIKASGTDGYAAGAATIQIGSYEYAYNDTDTSKEAFSYSFPRTESTYPYSAVRATVTGTANLNFARVLGISSKSVQATAVAVHRPRDVFIIMDLSRSMRFQSLMSIPEIGARTTSMNPDPDYPKFGHYSDTTGAGLYGNTIKSTGNGENYDPGNQTYTSNSGTPIVEDFYSNAVGATPSSTNRAFTRKAASLATTPNGDNYLKTASGTTLNAGNSYVHTMTEFNAGSANTNIDFERKGYGKYVTWNGYTEGPAYYGKTFFVWPPNTGFGGTWSAPSSLTDTSYKWHTWGDSNPRDWRQRFFVAVNTSSSNKPGVIQHNTILFDSSGYLRTPGTSVTVTENGSNVNYTYRINYAAVLYWLSQSPVHFPSTMQAGRIRYYTAIPDGTDTALNNRFWTTKPSSMTNNERFWKAYIDYVFGFESSSASTANGYSDISSTMGVGDFYTFNGSTIQVRQRTDRPATPSSAYVNLSTNPTSPYTTGTTGAYQVSTTAPYQTTTVTSTGAKSAGASSVTVNALGTNPVANQNYVTFGTSATAYKLTTTSKTILAISPNLSANVANSAAVKVYSSNNAVGAKEISVTALPNLPVSASDPENDYVGFNNSTTTYYSLTTPASNTKLTISTGLSTAVNLSGASVEVYASNGAIGKTQMSVTGLDALPVANKDYIVFDSDPTNAYLITNVSSMTNGYILTLSGGLINAVNINGTGVKLYSPYMDYSDDVRRPKHQFWFGGMTFVDWLGNYDSQLWWPGNVHEAQAWACKVGIQTAIDDIKNNHPNDFLGMTFFSNPRTSRTGTGYHNRALVPLGRNYQQLKDSLWFPPSTVTDGVKEISPYDSDMSNVPRANGSTAPGMGFMIAYNQLSNSSTELRSYATPTTTYRGNAGGLGRKGSQRIIIFETDGAPNTRGYIPIISAGADSYYPIRIKNPVDITSTSNTEWPTSGSYDEDDVYSVVQQIAALDTASIPGHSTSRRPALVYPIAYGSLFDKANPSDSQTNALTFMQTVAYHGNTATTKTASDFNDMYRIYGTNTQRITRMQTAFKNIMQTGTQVTLIE